MVLYEGDGNSIYTSADLKEWTYQSHMAGFYECPELFELPVDNDEGHKKWVMYGGDGDYMIGTFDGKTFSPETDKLKYNYGSLYAAQTFNSAPDKRRIQIGWGSYFYKGIREARDKYLQSATFPSELTLKTTPEGIRLLINPVPELSLLYTKTHSIDNVKTGSEEVKEVLSNIKSKQLHIVAGVVLKNSSTFGIDVNGYKIEYGNNTRVLNEKMEIGSPVNKELTLEIIVDRLSIEVYINNGLQYSYINYDSSDNEWGLSFTGSGSNVLKHLEIHELKSIWEDQN